MNPFSKQRSLLALLILVRLLSVAQSSPTYAPSAQGSNFTFSNQVAQSNSINITNEQAELKRYEQAQVFSPTGNGTDYDIKYHQFNVRINPDTPAGKYIKGNVITYFETKAAGFNLLKFDFASSLVVDSVVYHGMELKAMGNVAEVVDTLKITLPAPLPANKLDTVRIYYKGIPPTQSGGFGYVLSTHGSSPVRNYVYVLAEPYYARDWWPCKLDMYDKIDSMDMHVNVPSGFRAAGNGILQSTTTVGSNVVYHWKHRYPIAAYLITTAVANYDEYINGPANINGTNTPMFHYVFPEHNTSLAKANFDKTKVFLETLSSNSLFGDYPFKSEKYGNFEMGYSGMENQTFTGMVYSKFDDANDWTTNAHETAHQWFGNKVTCGSWAHIWVNEGFARYSELVAAEFSPISLNPNLASRRSAIKTTALGTTTETTYRPDTSSVGTIFVSHVYERGAMILGMLRLIMGDAAFFQGLRNYLNDPAFAYKAALTSDLQQHMEAVYGSSLNEFFSDWIYGRGVPSYNIGWARTGNRMHFQLTQTRSTGSTVSHFEMPVQIKVQGAIASQTVIFTIYNKDGMLSDIGYAGNKGSVGLNRIFYDLPFTPSSVTVSFDPNNLTLANGTVSYNAILPLDDIQLKANQNVSSIVVSWETENPENALNYTVERSANGIDFHKLETLRAKTGTAVVNRYSYTDEAPLHGRNFYRLRAIKIDGSNDYSPIVSQLFSDNKSIRVYPNPVNQEMDLHLPPELLGGKIVVYLFNNLGEKVIHKEIIYTGVRMKIDIRHLPAGVYNCQILANEIILGIATVLKNAR